MSADKELAYLNTKQARFQCAMMVLAELIASKPDAKSQLQAVTLLVIELIDTTEKRIAELNK